MSDKEAPNAPPVLSPAQKTLGPGGRPMRRTPRPSLSPYLSPDFLPKQLKDRIRKIREFGPVQVAQLGFGQHGSGPVAEALAPLAGQGAIKVTIIDNNPAAFVGKSCPPGVEFKVAPEGKNLGELLAGKDVVLIATPPGQHRPNIEMAMAAQVPIVLSQKPLTPTPLDARGLIENCNRALMGTAVGIVSHYLLFSSVSLVQHWLNQPPLHDSSPFEIKHMIVVLREEKGIEPAQIVAQSMGAADPAQHGLALAWLLLGLEGWELGPCYTAHHPESPIPNPTYGAFCFFRPGQTLRILLGKSQAEDESKIYLIDRKGRMLVWDRRKQSVLFTEAAWTVEACGDPAENPYVRLFAPLAGTAELPPVLTPHTAHRILCLLEDAMNAARPLNRYPTGSWVPPGFATVQHAREAYACGTAAVPRRPPIWSNKPPVPPTRWPADTNPDKHTDPARVRKL